MKKITSLIICFLLLVLPFCSVYAETEPAAASDKELILIDSNESFSVYSNETAPDYTAEPIPVYSDDTAGENAEDLIILDSTAPSGQSSDIISVGSGSDASYDYSYDSYAQPRTFAQRFASSLKVGIFLGILVGLITILIQVKSMKTITKASSAANYLDEGSFVLRNRRDIFLYRSESRVLVEQQQPNKGPGPRR